MVADLLELSPGEFDASACFDELTQLDDGTLVLIESPCRSLWRQVQVTVDSVDHFMRKCGVKRFLECGELVEAEINVVVEESKSLERC
jgi:hypothetical protein